MTRIFDVALSQGAVAAIALYQKYLSPRKGFSCPHRLLHGGESCSGFVKRTIHKSGIREAIPLARQRFSDCHVAAQILRAKIYAANDDDSSCRTRAQNIVKDAAQECLPDICCEYVDCTDCSALECGTVDCSVIDCGACACWPW